MRRRGLANSDSEESEGESPLGSSDSESEVEAVPLARRRGVRGAEDEGEEGGAPESQQSESDITDSEDESEDEGAKPPTPAAAAKKPVAGRAPKATKGGAGRGGVDGGRGRGRGAQQRAQKPPSAHPGKAAGGRGGARQDQAQQQSAKKLVYRPKNPSADASSVPAEGAAISAATEDENGNEKWGDMSAGDLPVSARASHAKPARAPKKRDAGRGRRDNKKENTSTSEQQEVEGTEGTKPSPRSSQGRRKGRDRAANGDQSASDQPLNGDGTSAEDGVQGEGQGEEEGQRTDKKKPDPDDPQFVPRGRFFMHDDRYGGGKGPRPRPDEAYNPEQEEIWTHDGYERLSREEHDGRRGRNRRRGKAQGAGGRGGGGAAPYPSVAPAQVPGEAGVAAPAAQPYGDASSAAPVAATAAPTKRGEFAKRGRGKGQRGGRGGHLQQQYGAALPDQGHVTQLGNGGAAVAGRTEAAASAGGPQAAPKRYSSQRVATTDESASLAAKAVAAAATVSPVSAAAAPHHAASAVSGFASYAGVMPAATASSPIRPNARPFRPKGRGNGLFLPVGYNPYASSEYGAGAPYYPPPAFPAYGYTQGQFPTIHTNYLEADPAIIDASVPTYSTMPQPPAPVEAGPDPTLMGPQLTAYGAYPPPFFYSAPVFPGGPYMDNNEHQTGSGRGRGRGRGNHHQHNHHLQGPVVASPSHHQDTVYYPPPSAEDEGESFDGVDHDQQHLVEGDPQHPDPYDGDHFSPETVDVVDPAEISNGGGGGGGEVVVSHNHHQHQPSLPTTVASTASGGAGGGGSKLRAKAPKWVPKGAGAKQSVETAAS